MMHSLDLHPACALQGEGIQERQVPLPELPPNAVYVSHQNLCYDWGTFGWVLQTGMVDTTKYKHIIFMNSSSRGPFLPAYWPVSIHPKSQAWAMPQKRTFVTLSYGPW